MTPDSTLRQVLDFVLGRRHDANNQFVFVSSPPGGGKTQLVELVAVAASQLGLLAATACPRAEQAFALVRRLQRAYPTQRIQLLVGKDRPLPADLDAQAIPLGAGCFDVGRGNGLPLAVGTVAKLAVLASSGAVTCDLLICDEAYQVALAEFAPLLCCSPRFLLIGDPGQLPPLVLIDSEPFATAQHRVHEPAAQELLRHRPRAPHLRLARTHRLPPDTVPFLQPLYPGMPFRASASALQRRLHLSRPAQARDGVDRALDVLAGGASLVVLELPGRTGRGTQVDQEMAAFMADVAERMLARGMAPAGGAPFTTLDIGIVDPHVTSGAVVRRELEARQLPGGSPVVGTPEVWQGLERPVMIVRHPLDGAESGSAFSLDPGRLSVSLTRHQFGCIVVARAGVEYVLQAALPASGSRPLGSPDRSWHGLQFQRQLWQALRCQGRIVPV
jgi:hypothetical protein